MHATETWTDPIVKTPEAQANASVVLLPGGTWLPKRNAIELTAALIVLRALVSTIHMLDLG